MRYSQRIKEFYGYWDLKSCRGSPCFFEDDTKAKMSLLLVSKVTFCSDEEASFKRTTDELFHRSNRFVL